MRIAFVTNEYTTENYFSGGIANYLHRICLFLKSAGHDPEVFVASDIDKDIVSENILIHRVNIPQVETTNLATHSWVLTSFYLNEKLEQVNQKNKFDIVQYSNWMATAIYRLQNIPSVIRLSSFQPLWVQNSQTTLEEKLELISLSKVDSIYCPSQFLASTVKKHIKQKIKIIETPFKIEVKKYDYTVYNQQLKDKKYLLFFGQISPNKGIVEIQKIIPTLLKNNSNLYFVIIGIGDNLKQQHNRQIYFPVLKHELLYPIVRHSYAVVLPSRVDNLPNTCLEAMGHGKIVIGTTGTSFEQLINHGQNGFLCLKQNPNDLLNTINIVLKLKPNQKIKIEKNALKTINRLNPKIIIPKLLKYYQTIIKQHSKRLGYIS